MGDESDMVTAGTSGRTWACAGIDHRALSGIRDGG